MNELNIHLDTNPYHKHPVVRRHIYLLRMHSWVNILNITYLIHASIYLYYNI